MRPQHEINAEIESHRPEREDRVRGIERMFAIFEAIREMEANARENERHACQTIVERISARFAEEFEEQAVTIAKHRIFIRSARMIVQHFASANPKHIWDGHEIDPLGAHGWIEAESAEVGTNRDGGDPKVQKATS